jgi:hypothetical protein
MTTVTRTTGSRFTRIILIATAALAAGLFAFPAPASAASGHGHGHGNGHGQSYGHGQSNGHDHGNGNGHSDGYGRYDGHSNGAAHGYAAFPTVPRTIIVGQRGYYQPYYSGRVYYGPHHHYHAAYRFPVYVGGSVVYQPYYYCGDSLFVGGAVALPHLAFGINFGSPGGVSFGGFYSSPGYVAPAPYPYVAYTTPVYPAPAPYYGPDVYYRGRHCEHGDGDYDGD